MPNESLDIYLHGQQLKPHSLSPLEMVDTEQVTLGVPGFASGAMQTDQGTLMPFEDEEGKGVLPPAEKIFALPPPLKESNAAILRTKQLWEGTVITIEGNCFKARVVDRTNPENPAEAVVFELDEISVDDRELIQPGAAFYWALGTETSPRGQRKNVNFVNFRRLPSWSRESFQDAGERTNQITSLFNQE